MKIKKIATVITSGSTISLQDVKEGDSVVQWVGDIATLYRLDNVPYLQETSFYSVFDIEKSKQDKYDYYHNNIGNIRALTEDLSPNETSLYRTMVEIKYKGVSFVGMFGEGEMLLVDSKYLKPLQDLEQIGYWRRRDTSGQAYIVAKDGMLATAIIYPTKIGRTKKDTALMSELKEITKIVHQNWLESQSEEDRLQGQISYIDNNIMNQ